MRSVIPNNPQVICIPRKNSSLIRRGMTHTSPNFILDVRTLFSLFVISQGLLIVASRCVCVFQYTLRHIPQQLLQVYNIRYALPKSIWFVLRGVVRPRERHVRAEEKYAQRQAEARGKVDAYGTPCYEFKAKNVLLHIRISVQSIQKFSVKIGKFYKFIALSGISVL